jgi:hypothetical protein
MRKDNQLGDEKVPVNFSHLTQTAGALTILKQK